MDTTVTTYTATRIARAIDRARRGVRLCTCGGEYQATQDGRRLHRMLFFRTPSPADEGGAR